MRALSRAAPNPEDATANPPRRSAPLRPGDRLDVDVLDLAAEADASERGKPRRAPLVACCLSRAASNLGAVATEPASPCYKSYGAA